MVVRVCKPGGTIAMAAFTPDGVGGAFFEVFGRYAPPPPPGVEPPITWGNEDHVRSLFGDRVTLQITRREYIERAPTPEAYCAFFHETFGPVIAIRRSLADDPARSAAFDRDFLDFATRSNRGPAGGHAESTLVGANQAVGIVTLGHAHPKSVRRSKRRFGISA